MQRILIFCLSGLIIIYSCRNTGKIQKANPSAIPVLKIKNDTGAMMSLQISKLSVDVLVTGNIATTTFDITFSNPLDRVLEGEFEFPLADGQNISRYALDINGQLREGVVVEKEKARVAFENTIRQKVDPGLVEKTKGNNFRTRIYPIPANGEKRVLIGIEQELQVVDKSLLYQLPLYVSEKLKQFSIQSLVQNSGIKPGLQDNELNGFEFTGKKNDWQASFSANNFSLQQTIAFSIPFNEENGLVFTGDYNNHTAFYITTPVEAAYKPKAAAGSVVLLWDISASAEKRNIDKEIELIKKYAERVKDQQVTLVPFNIFTKQPEIFNIQNGEASALIRRLKNFSFDGGTQLGAIDLKKFTADEIILFTDGLSTFGKDEMMLSPIPVTVINSSPSADHSYLKFIATQTHGKYLDLTKLELDEAADNMQKRALQFISATYNDTEMEEVYPATTSHGGFSIAGILKTASAVIKLNYGYGNNITRSQTFTVTKAGEGYDNIKKIWASMKIAQLDLQYAKNKETITALGKEFSIVTQNTSLIVLDRVEDYVQYEIVPPADLQKEYFTLLKEKQQTKEQEKDLAFDEALDAMKKIEEWWKINFKPAGVKQKPVPDADRMELVMGNAIVTNSANSFIAVDSATTGSAAYSQGFTSSANLTIDADREVSVADARMEELRLPEAKSAPGTAAKPSDSIQLAEWKPDVPYLKQLEKTSPSAYFTEYILLKKDYKNQPSFYADVARFLFSKKNNELALQVLSNVNELKLEDAELLRIVANQLLEMGEKELAVETFKDILEIRGEQPQSYRDLALAYNEAGNYDEAVKLLYKVVTGTWDSRFGEIKVISLNEMNAIISSQPQVNTVGMDKRLIKAMPVDVRIVIGWSSDNSDIDLWVTDPRKEKCFYSNPLTPAGGRISNDVTQGYGPEEYVMKKALNGEYLIEINFFGDGRQTLGGPVTVKAELFTNFGKPNQKREIINCRLTNGKEVIKIGSLNIKS